MLGIFIATLVASGCLGGSSSTGAEGGAENALIVAYTQAYNDRDLDRMQIMMHADIEWIDVSGSAQTIVTSDKAQLVEEMASYFKQPYASSSALEGWGGNGNFVSVTEVASWTTPAGEQKSQAAIAVYEIDGDQIRRVWYFPAQTR